MRKYTTIYLFFIVFSLNIFAQDNTDVSIKILIERIKEAKVEDKRVLINQLKLRLRKINKESHKKTIMKLKSSLNSDKNRGYTKFNNRRRPSHSLLGHRHFLGGHR